MAIKRRIIGSEFETPVSIKIRGTEGYTTLNSDEHFVDHSIDKSRLIKAGKFLSNGGKLYTDQDFPEYSTPEVLDFDELLLRELAGERIVIDALIRYMSIRPEIEAAYIRKCAIDDFRKTWGYHLNFLSERRYIKEISEKTMQLLALHIISSQAMLGGGTIQRTQVHDTHCDLPFYYSYGQKVLDLGKDAGTGSTHTFKALINTRDEPLADKSRYRRIHVISVDPHVSPWATKMTAGTISLILRAIEQQKGLHLQLDTSTENFVATASRMAKDVNFKEKLTLVNGRGRSTINANDLQEELLMAVSQTEHTPEEALILEEWTQAVQDLKADPTRLANRSDAIGRLERIRKLNDRLGHNPDDMSTDIARATNWDYDKIFLLGVPKNPRGTKTPMDGYWASYPHRMRMGTMANGMPPEIDIQKAIEFPPENTRAYGRGNAIRAGIRKPRLIDWNQYDIDGMVVTAPDPYEPEPCEEDFIS